jgi:hypothetical protein
MALCLAIASLLALAACSDAGTDGQTTGSTETETNPPVDRDPTPDTGTGGDQQGSTPEGAKPAN